MPSKYKLPFGVLSLVILSTGCTPQNCDNKCVVDQTYVHKYGVEVTPDFWSNSGEHGSVISTMSDGIVITHSYESGLLDGETTYTFPHSSQIQQKELYSQGTLLKQTTFFFDGTPQQEIAYDTPLGVKTVTLWYVSGTPKSIEKYSGDLLMSGEYFNSANQRDALVENYEGTRIVRNDQGQLLSTDTIQKGLLSMRLTYHANGNPKEKIPYNGGVIQGTKLTFNQEGDPNSAEEWKAGKQDGMSTVYQHGEKYAEVPYAAGVKQGVEKRYRDGKDLAQEITWKDGQQHGPTTSYLGETEKTDWYYEGTLTSKSNYDFLVNKPVAR